MAPWHTDKRNSYQGLFKLKIWHWSFRIFSLKGGIWLCKTIKYWSTAENVLTFHTGHFWRWVLQHNSSVYTHPSRPLLLDECFWKPGQYYDKKYRTSIISKPKYITPMNDCCFRSQFYISKLYWTEDNLGKWVNFGMNHAPGAGLITPPVDLQSSVLPVCYLYNSHTLIPITHIQLIFQHMNLVTRWFLWTLLWQTFSHKKPTIQRNYFKVSTVVSLNNKPWYTAYNDEILSLSQC